MERLTAAAYALATTAGIGAEVWLWPLAFRATLPLVAAATLVLGALALGRHRARVW